MVVSKETTIDLCIHTHIEYHDRLMLYGLDLILGFAFFYFINFLVHQMT